MAAYCGRKYNMPSHADDLAQEGSIALVNAMRRTVGPLSWEDYGKHVVFNAMKDYARSQWSKVWDVLDDEVASKAPGPVEQIEATEQLARLRTLPPRERMVLLRAAAGETHSMIAADLGISRVRVTALYRQAQERIAA